MIDFHLPEPCRHALCGFDSNGVLTGNGGSISHLINTLHFKTLLVYEDVVGGSFEVSTRVIIASGRLERTQET